MALALKDVDHWVDGRHDVQLRNIRHAIKARMAGRGYAWLSERLLLRDMCRCGWSEGNGLIRELVDAGEFFRVTARGRGRGKGRTLYFFGWTSSRVIRDQLEENNMPLAAYHAAERCFAEFRARIFFRKKMMLGSIDIASVKTEAVTKKDGRTTPDQSFSAPRGSPPTAQTTPPRPQQPRRWTALSKHGEAMRRLRAEQEASRQLHDT